MMDRFISLFVNNLVFKLVRFFLAQRHKLIPDNRSNLQRKIVRQNDINNLANCMEIYRGKIAIKKVNARIIVKAGRLDNIQLGSAKNFV